MHEAAVDLERTAADGVGVNAQLLAETDGGEAVGRGGEGGAQEDGLVQGLLLPFVKALRQEAKQIKLAITPAIIEGLGDALARGQGDLAVTIPEFAMSDMPSRLLYRERYVVAVRPQHPLTRRGAMTLDRFCAFDHVIVSPTGGSFEGPTDEALWRLRRKRTVRYSVPSFLLLPELLLTDDLVALVPSRLLRGNIGGLAVLRAPVEIPGFDVIAVWHPRVDKDEAHRWLRTRLAAVAKHSAPHDWNKAYWSGAPRRERKS